MAAATAVRAMSPRSRIQAQRTSLGDRRHRPPPLFPPEGVVGLDLLSRHALLLEDDDGVGVDGPQRPARQEHLDLDVVERGDVSDVEQTLDPLPTA